MLCGLFQRFKHGKKVSVERRSLLQKRSNAFIWVSYFCVVCALFLGHQKHTLGQFYVPPLLNIFADIEMASSKHETTNKDRHYC